MSAEISEEMLKKSGTTTVGIKCTDGVVLATERRATMGYMIAHKYTKKLFKIDENIGMTIAGIVGDAQLLVRYLTAEVELYKLKRNTQITIKGASTLLANILSGARFFPYFVGLILGGVDKEGSHVYSLDLIGGSIEDKYVSVGSGSPFVYGVLEDYYKDDISLSEGIDIALRGLTASMKRDAASGDGYSVAAITEKEYRDYTDDEIKKRLSKLKL